MDNHAKYIIYYIWITEVFSALGRDKKYIILAERPGVKKQGTRRSKYNIKMHLKEVGFEVVDWILPSVQWRAVVITMTNDQIL
jgi:hypothetical protein